MSRRLVGAAVLAAFEALSLLAIIVSLPSPAQAQWWNDRREQFMHREAPRPRDSGGFFENLFGGGNDGGWRREPAPRYRPRPVPERQRHVDYSRAPPPSKEVKPEPGVPVTSIVVMGDAMADWLAYGLEDAFSDTPNVEIVREAKPNSGLIHYQAHSDLDWWHVAREILTKQKANYVVMMIGIHDRQNISERDLTKEAEKQAAEKKAAEQADAGAGKDAAGKDSAAETATKQRKTVNGPLEFRTDQWAKAYAHRIDETIAALKSKGVPVFWVGLPSIRGTKSTADAHYLNDLYRARAERDGAIYIDVWDGFVDDSGKYTSYGPDYEGQMRRLRTPDGVFFTKYGARKLAHYVEREIRRYMNNRAVVALPTGPVAPVPGNGSPAARPLVGPVVPLTSISGGGDTLLGAAGTSRTPNDAIAARVLMKGDALKAPPGRADDHAWPPGSAVYGEAPKAEQPTAPAKASPSAAALKPATSAADPVAAGSSSAAAGATARSAGQETAPAPPKEKASARIEPPVVAKPPVGEPMPVEPKQRRDTKRSMPSRHERARRSDPRETRRLIPPREVERPPRATPAPPPPQQSDDLFGRDGLFGWMR